MDWTRILEVLGWVGFVFILLTVVGVLGAIAIVVLSDWEFAAPLLLIAIIVIPGTILMGYYLYRLFPLEQQIYFGIPKYVKCPYCGMNNLTIDVFCTRCGKVLPRKLTQDTVKIDYS